MPVNLRTFFSSHRIDSSGTDVRQVVADLEKLNRATETGFLQVGGSLMSFLSASRNLHSLISGLNELVSGEQLQRACEALLAVSGYLEETRRRSENWSRALMTLQSGADRIRSGFSSFGRIVLSFRIAAMAVKIEVAHLGSSQQNLESLAEDVRFCVDGIQERISRIIEAASEFHMRIRATLGDVSRFEAVQLRELSSLMSEVETDMQSLRERQKEGVEGSFHLGTEMDAVTRELGAVATSIQFHDITRQQVEHVIEALRGLADETKTGRISSADAVLLRLQRAQLQSAASAFAQSTQKIDQDLGAIATRVEAMVSASHRIYGPQQKEEKESFLDRMQRRFAEIARSVAELHGMDCATRATVAGLRDTSRDLSAAVSEIQSIEAQLSHISINAVVAATHIGEPGEALNVIALAIRRLEMECASRSAAAQESLDSIGEAIHSLSGGVSTADDESGAALLQDLNSRVNDLQSNSASSVGAASSVASEAESLCRSLQESRDRFTIGRLFADTVKTCCDALDRAASRAPLSELSDLSQAAEGHAHIYTMESEREVHRALANGTLPPLGQLPKSDSVGSGDDAEFF